MALVASALLLAGCAAAPTVRSGPEPILAADGILAGDTGLEISFGRAREGAVTAAAKLVGRPPDGGGPATECGAGPVDTVRYPGGLTLNFTPGGFAGWVAQDDGRVWRSAGGLRTGMTGAAAAAMPAARVTRSSLGDEVSVGGVHGVLGSDGTVRTLYAGITCFAR